MAIYCPKCHTENPNDSNRCRKCGARLHLAEDQAPETRTMKSAVTDVPDGLAAGTLIDGKYKLVLQLGSGGMGVVYKAEQSTPIHRSVALKVIKLGMDTQEVIARFELEKQALAVMKHPNIAGVYDAGVTESGRPYFVMEYVAGVPITDYCDQHRLTVPKRLELFMALCDAVHHAHQKGVIHRDLKPSNVLVETRDGKPVPKIIDFGIAKAIEQRMTEQTLFTAQGQFIGTPEYMSPEQAEASGLDIDIRTDVYSLGMLLYELLVGVLPFDPRELRMAGYDEIRRRIREEEPFIPSKRLTALGNASSLNAVNRSVEVSVLVKQLCGDLDWIVMKALEKDRSRRYASASSFAEDIERHLNHMPVAAGPPGATYRFGKFVQRHKLGVTAALVIVITVIVGLTGLSYGLIAAVNARNAAALERDKATAVNSFLQDMLKSPDPGIGDRNVRVIDVLERLSGVIEVDLGDQPEIEAEVQNTLARSFNSLGYYQKALPHINRTLEIRNSLLGPAHSSTLKAQNALANTLESLGRLEESEAIYKKNLDIRRRVLGAEHPDTLNSMHDLAALYNKKGRYLESVDLARQTLAIRKRVLGPKHEDIYTNFLLLSNVLTNLKEYDEAEKFASMSLERSREIVEERKLAHGLEHPIVLNSEHLYAYVLYMQGKYGEAEKIQRDLLERQRSVFGPNHDNTLSNQFNLANTLKHQGKLREAESLYLTTMDKFMEAYGVEHPHTLIVASGLASVLDEQNKFSEAESIYRETLNVQKRIMGLDNPWTLDTAYNLAESLRKRSHYREAEVLYRQIIEEERKLLGKEHQDSLKTVYNLAIVIRNQGCLEEAEDLLVETSKMQERLLGLDHPDTLATNNALAITLSQAGKFEQAEGFLIENIESKKRSFGPEHENTVRSMSNLAGVYIDHGEYGKGEKLVRKAIDILERTLGGDYSTTLITYANLGEILNNQGKYGKAEALLRTTLAKMRKKLRNNHPYIIFCLKTLAMSLDKQGKNDQAARIIQEIKALDEQGRK